VTARMAGHERILALRFLREPKRSLGRWVRFGPFHHETFPPRVLAVGEVPGGREKAAAAGLRINGAPCR